MKNHVHPVSERIPYTRTGGSVAVDGGDIWGYKETEIYIRGKFG